MDTRLLKHYERELAYMRDMGQEFAQSFPKVAARLGMQDVEVTDPYVERLLEGVAFLTSRVQLELELQYPKLTSHLLEIVYPHYLSPTPSMTIATLHPDPANSGLSEGYHLKRGTTLRSKAGQGAGTPCIFRTGHALTMWPIEIAETEYVDGRGPLIAAGLDQNTAARAAIRLRLRRSGGAPIADLPLDHLPIFITSQTGSAWALHEVLCADNNGLWARSTDRRADWMIPLPGGIRPMGLEHDEALLPLPKTSFDGYRLLQEYFAMPERFHFVELSGLRPALAAATGSDVDIYILLKDGYAEIAPMIQPESFALNTVPAINLFEKRCDRVRLREQTTDAHVVGDRTAPLDFEIYALQTITGISGEGEDDVPFRPFYSSSDFTATGERHPAYFTVERRMRQRTEKERLQGTRTSYLGSETYVTLVDPKQAPYPTGLEQLAVTAMVTNRDLPLLLAGGDKDVFHLPDGGPVKSVTTPVPPTRPKPTIAQGDTAWRLISHLSLNYLSIADSEGGTGAEALRELVGLYVPEGDRVIEKQMEGIVGIESRPIVRRMADEVLATAVRGLEIRLTFDESFFEGTSTYHLGAVLERFFRKYVTLNSFTETVLITQQRGEIARWKPEGGRGRII